MKTTRILTVLTAFLLIFGLAACGTGKDNAILAKQSALERQARGGITKKSGKQPNNLRRGLSAFAFWKYLLLTLCREIDTYQPLLFAMA